VASSTGEALVRLILQRIGLAHYFPLVVSGEALPRSKPHPDIFLLAARLLALDPARCVVVEDSANGVRAAKAAGMYCIAYRNPTSGPQDLTLADEVIGEYWGKGTHFSF
jgi:beta-phosphoglucomutase-like phosphatase (HAD superfamily)